ncbi:MAG: hypothetical protein WC635_14480 [Bacteriovorax sp.]|jgi:hypothetical protein
MKTLLALFLLTFSAMASAEVCTSVIKDRSGYEWESFTRSSYSQQAACDQAIYDCRGALSYGQSMGRYYDAFCEIKYDRQDPYPDPRGVICQADLVDRYMRTIRMFTAPGATEYEACTQSMRFCQDALNRRDTMGTNCVNRGLIDNRNDPRPPTRTKTEQCTANRLDPAGMFIQRYVATAVGPMNSDVRGQACRQAVNDCSRDLRGRQTCQISR